MSDPTKPDDVEVRTTPRPSVPPPAGRRALEADEPRPPYDPHRDGAAVSTEEERPGADAPQAPYAPGPDDQGKPN